MTRVATIILNWNGESDTIECLSSLARVQHEGWEHRVVVVDNASDRFPKRILEEYPEVTVLRNSVNLGFAEGMNVGISWARTQGVEYVVLLNNDTTVQPDAFSILLSLAARKGVGAVMPLIKFYGSEETWYAGGSVIRPFGRVQPLTAAPSSDPYESQLFTACCVLLPVRVLDAIGDFDPRFYLYLEDTDLALRIRDGGFKIWVAPRAVVYHKVSRSSGGSESPNVLYYLVRNNLLLIKHRSSGVAERVLGCGYMTALSMKICLNTVLGKLPRKKAVVRSVFSAWYDYTRGNWGARR